MKKSRSFLKIALWTVGGSILGAFLGIGSLWWTVSFSPTELDLPSPSNHVVDRTGRILRVCLNEEGLLWLSCPVEEMGDWLPMATIAAEDGRFLRHPGVDPLALGRAVGQVVKNRRVTSGGSTLTMQVAKLLRPAPRTLPNKVGEMIRALKMERVLTKEEILEAYLNMAPYGGNLLGARTASLWYFGKEPEDLSLGEASLLAGLPQAPTRLRPDRNPEGCKERRRYVLERMLARGMVDELQVRAALKEPLPEDLGPAPFRCPHLTREVLETSRNSAGEIISLVDPQLQRWAEEGIREEVARLRSTGVSNGAVVVLNVSSGALVAMVGSADFFSVENQGQVNGTLALRSPGSALKPFLYAMALDAGLLTPETVLPDCPMHFGGYAPENYDGKYSQLVSMRLALQHSLNVPAVVTMDRVGVSRALDRLRKVGLDTLDRTSQEYGYALALGGCEVKLLDLSNAYASLARGGTWREVRWVESDPITEGRRVFSKESSYLIWEILSEVPIERWLPVQMIRKRPMRVAWKTGTSYGHRDAWTVGYTPEWVVGVWLGNFSGEPARGLVGRDAAAPLVARLFRKIYGQDRVPVPIIPEGLERRPICAVSGQPLGPDCPSTASGWFIRGVSSETPCQVHQKLPVDDHTGHLLCRDCWKGHSFHWETFAVWPSEVASVVGETASLPGHNPDCTRVARGKGPVIVSPREREVYFLLEETPGKKSALMLKALGDSDATTLFWFSNGEYLGCSSPGKTLPWNPSSGNHKLHCSDDRGRTASISFRVADSG